MKYWKGQKIKAIVVVLLFMMAVSGCGNTGKPEQAVETAEHAAEEKNEKETEGEKEDTLKDSAKEDPELKYMELTEVEDYYGDKFMRPEETISRTACFFIRITDLHSVRLYMAAI